MPYFASYEASTSSYGLTCEIDSVMTPLLRDSVPMNQHVKHRCSRSAHGRVLLTFGRGTERKYAGGWGGSAEYGALNFWW